RTAIEMELGSVVVGEHTRRLEDVIDAEVFPRQRSRVLLAEGPGLLAGDDESVIGSRDVLREASVRRVVLEEVGEVRSGHEVVDRDDFDVLALRSDAVNKSADSAET